MLDKFTFHFGKCFSNTCDSFAIHYTSKFRWCEVIILFFNYVIWLADLPLHSICRDFERVNEIHLAPVVEALAPIAKINVESQV